MQVNTEKIPQYLKTHGRFCTWKYELRNGNQTKVPYMPGSTRKAQVDTPTTFKSFEAAMAARCSDGIGILVNGKIVGIDTVIHTVHGIMVHLKYINKAFEKLGIVLSN